MSGDLGRYEPLVPGAHAHADDQADVVALLDDLPREQREVLLLRVVAEMDWADVARVLGCKPNTAQARTQRGLAALRKRLGEEAA